MNNSSHSLSKNDLKYLRFQKNNFNFSIKEIKEDTIEITFLLNDNIVAIFHHTDKEYYLEYHNDKDFDLKNIINSIISENFEKAQNKKNSNLRGVFYTNKKTSNFNNSHLSFNFEALSGIAFLEIKKIDINLLEEFPEYNNFILELISYFWNVILVDINEFDQNKIKDFFSKKLFFLHLLKEEDKNKEYLIYFSNEIYEIFVF